MPKKIKLARPLFLRKEKLLKNIASILDTGRLIKGKYTASFEEKFAEYCKAKYAVSVSSCTAALEIVLRYIGVSGSEVIVPTETFIATANAVIFAGGKPVLADIKKETYFLDPEEVKRLISKKTKAVIVVNIAGLISPEIEEIKKICDRSNLPLIEDCAHAVGASYKNKKAGTFGLAGCFSFYPTKIMTTCAGGMIITNDKKLAKHAKSLRLHGAGKGLDDIVNIGSDWFLDEVRSAIGLNQLESLEHFLKRRARIAEFYDESLRTTDLIKRFPASGLSRHVYYKYPVQIQADIDVEKMKKDFPKKYGFELESLYWPTCHLQPIYKKRFGYCLGDFPVAESTISKQVTLPLHGGLKIEDAKHAFKCLLSEINQKKERKCV